MLNYSAARQALLNQAAREEYAGRAYATFLKGVARDCDYAVDADCAASAQSVEDALDADHSLYLDYLRLSEVESRACVQSTAFMGRAA